jgi:hypothetical protein
MKKCYLKIKLKDIVKSSTEYYSVYMIKKKHIYDCADLFVLSEGKRLADMIYLYNVYKSKYIQAYPIISKVNECLFISYKDVSEIKLLSYSIK